MAFKASDYPEITKANDAYSVARSEYQKAEARLNETDRKSPNYKRYLEERNARKEEMDAALSKYKTLVSKRKKTYEDEKLKAKYKKQLNTNKAKLTTLEDDLQRAKDKGEDTTGIQNAIDKIKGNNEETEDKLSGVGKNNRPKGVPAEAKFNTVTGNWESGNQKWNSSGEAVVETKTKKVPKPSGDGTPTPTPTPTPSGTPTTGSFDPGRFRMGEEASMGATKPVIPGQTSFEKVLAEAVKLYGGIDEIFSTDEELKNLLTRAIGDVATAKDDMDEDQFVNLLQNTNWFKSNAGPIRQRGFERRQYNALVKKIKTDDPNYKAKIEELNKTSTYGRGLQDVIELLRENAKQLGRQISEEDLRVIAEGIYDYANEDDAVKIRNAILGVGSFGIGLGKDGKGITGVATGAAGQNLTTLRAVARANGFDLDTMFKDSITTWLDKIAGGESIETFKSIIRNTAKSGLPDKVAQLLDQGVDLETIYSPYKRLMSAVLELNPESIDLNDPTLRMGIGPDKEVSLYEYQRMLRKDPRWQYTNNAREDVSDSALTVLRNFGFQG